MKKKIEIKIKDNFYLSVTIDPSLDTYEDVVLFPEQLKKANEAIAKSGPPRFPGDNEYALHDQVQRLV